MENQIRAAKLYDVDLFLRVSRGGYADYVRGLEMDAAGLVVPHVMDADDARRVRDYTKFAPVGRRALDGGSNATPSSRGSGWRTISPPQIPSG